MQLTLIINHIALAKPGELVVSIHQYVCPSVNALMAEPFDL